MKPTHWLVEVTKPDDWVRPQSTFRMPNWMRYLNAGWSHRRSKTYRAPAAATAAANIARQHGLEATITPMVLVPAGVDE